LPKIRDHRNLTFLRSEIKLESYVATQDSHPGDSVQCTVLLMIAKLGGGATETLGGGGVGASCVVYIAELLRDSLARETMMQWRYKSPILLAFERFKPA